MDDFVTAERRGFAQYLAQRRWVFLVAYVGYMACYLVRNNVKVASDAMLAGLGVGAADLGLVMASFSVAYGVGKLVMGIVADHVSLRVLFSTALGLAAVLCISLTWMTSIAAFAVLAAVAGLVQGACAPAALALIGSWYPNRSRGARVALWNTSQNVGAALLPLLASAGIGLLGPGAWRVTFWAPGLLVLAVAAWTYWRGADRPWREGLPTLTEMYGRAGTPAIRIDDHSGYWQTAVRHVLLSRPILLLAAINTLLYFERFGVINWLKIFLVNDRGMSSSEANLTFSVLEGCAVAGALVFAFLAWRFPDRMALVGAIAMPLLAIAIIVYAHSWSREGTLSAACAVGMLTYGPQVIVNILTLNLVPPRVLGVAIGIVSLPSYLVGEVGANLILPAIARTAGWQGAHMTIAGATLLAGFLYYRLRPAERAAVVVNSE